MLTNISSYIQFSQYGEVKTFTCMGPKLFALNTFRSMVGRTAPVSAIIERKEAGYFNQGIWTIEPKTIDQLLNNL